MINNTSTITQYDLDFATVYMREKEQLLKVLQEGHPALLDIAQRIIHDYKHGKET